MINKIVDTIKDDIEALPWVERYGGLTFRMSFEHQGAQDGETLTRTVPISNYLNVKDCDEANDRYFYLMPDDQKKSIVYLEQLGNMTLTRPVNSTQRRYRDSMSGTINLRVVAWLNLSLLGSLDQNDTALFAMDLLRVVDGQIYNKVDGVPIFKVKWDVTTEVQKSMSIFQGYSYEERSHLMLYPYDFFAFDIAVSFYVKKNCLSALTVPDPIDCVDVNNDTMVLAGFGGDPLGGFDGQPLRPQ